MSERCDLCEQAPCACPECDVCGKRGNPSCAGSHDLGRRRFWVSGYGSHSWEVIDGYEGRQVCVIGMREQSNAQNRRANEPVPERNPETLAFAEKIRDILEAAHESGDLPLSDKAREDLEGRAQWLEKERRRLRERAS